MSTLLWGKVYYQDIFAGILREELGGSVSFAYDANYIDAGHPAIAYTLPPQSEKYLCHSGLHPFFDNLVAEGWLEHAQTRLLGKRIVSRFELLLAFGYDCAGAVSVVDPEPANLSKLLLDLGDPKEMAVLTSRASLSGVQPKLALIEKNGKYYPAKTGELSTYIAKFPSLGHDDLVINEYMTTQAFKALLPEDDVVDLSISPIEGFSNSALVIKRFDRAAGKRLHFEEFNQLLNRKPSSKYDGSYQEMSHFIQSTAGALPVESYRLYARILAGLLLGNTDMHFKNFAMFHAEAGLRLTPSYDQVAAVLYQYKTVALALDGASNRLIGRLKPKNLIALAQEFHLSPEIIHFLFEQLKKNKDSALEAIVTSMAGYDRLKDQLIKFLETRWKGTYALIGQTLLTKQKNVARPVD